MAFGGTRAAGSGVGVSSFVLCIPRIKAKPSGLPDSNFIFFVATKKTKQKKARRCAWHVYSSIFVGLRYARQYHITAAMQLYFGGALAFRSPLPVCLAIAA
jgi:hypothetical protein